ncbi:MAG: ABC transporter permease [Chloroflexi bacterium]|nr:ABC transporter permease [Chloroflexota bacterium]
MAVAAARRRRQEERLWAWGLPLGVFAVGAGLWELATINSESLIIPTFSQTMVGLYQLLFQTGQLWGPLLLSNQALVLGYVLAVTVGVGLGLGMARARWLESIADPYVHMMLAMPTAPLIPLVMMALGLGIESRVLIVFLFAFIYITVNTRAGVRNVDPGLIEMARSFGASEADVWRRILIPGAVPAILAGLRIGLGRAVNGMVVAELLLVATGIGNLLLEFRAAFHSGLLFATVLAVALEAIVLLALMRVLEDRLAPWASSVVGD